jgi:hypothetical protein
MCFVTRVAELAKLRREELLQMVERISEQNRILQATLRNRTARLLDLAVRIKAFHLLLLLLRGNLRRGPKFKSILEQVDSALSWSDGSDVAFPELGFDDQVSGVERDRHGRVRRSAPDDSWTPPFDELTFEQAAAYIDAEIRFVDAEWRVSWWTSELDEFDQAMPLQLLEKGRYRELWEYAASARNRNRL